MAEHHIKLNIGSKAELSAFQKVKGAIANVKQSIVGFAKGIGTNLMNIKAGFDMLKGAITSIGGALQKAFQFDKLTKEFKFLIGNIDDARTHMEMLKELGATPPFSMEEFAAASKQMMIFSDGVLGMKSSLELAGDVAAGTGKSVEEVGEAIAKAFANIRDGQPVKRAAMALKNLGAVTPATVAQLESMQEAGASNIEIWDALVKGMDKFKGAMDETGNTAEGAMGSLQSAWDDAVRTLEQGSTDILIPLFKDITSWLRMIEQNGTLDEWADGVKDSFQTVIDFGRGVLDFFGGLWTAIKATLGTALAFTTAMDEAGKNGEGWFNFKAGASAASEYWKSAVKGEKDPEEEKWDKEERERRKKTREARIKAAEEQEKKRIESALKKGNANAESGQLIYDFDGSRYEQSEKEKVKIQKEAEKERLEAHKEFLDEYEEMEKQAVEEAQEMIERPFKEAQEKADKIMETAYKNASKETGTKSDITIAQGELDAMKALLPTLEGKDKAKMEYDISKKLQEIANLQNDEKREQRDKRIRELKEDVDKLIEVEKAAKEVMEQTKSKDDILNPNGQYDMTTGEGRGDARNAANDAQKQAAREQRRRNANQHRLNNLVRDFNFNRHALSPKQQREALNEIRRRRAEREAARARAKIDDEKKRIKELQDALPDNVAKIKDTLDAFVRVNTVK